MHSTVDQPLTAHLPTPLDSPLHPFEGHPHDRLAQPPAAASPALTARPPPNPSPAPASPSTASPPPPGPRATTPPSPAKASCRTPILYRAVRMIAEAAASVPLLLYQGEEEIAEHPLLDLLARPNPGATAPDLLEAWYGFLLVSGNAYLEAVAVGGTVRELHTLRPDRMKVVPGPGGWPEAFDYTADGKTQRIAGEAAPGVARILHVKLFHPLSDHYGLSPIEAAARAIDIHNTASRWNKALLDNSARPSGALVYTARDGNLTARAVRPPQGRAGAGLPGRRPRRPPAAARRRPRLEVHVAQPHATWTSSRPSTSPPARSRSPSACPPMLLGIPGDNTYSNYQEATRTFWRSTVLPAGQPHRQGALDLARRLRTVHPASPGARPGADTRCDCHRLELRPDLDAIEALSTEREALWTRINAATFLTPDEKRAAVGYGPMGSDPAGLTPGSRAWANRE